MTDESDKVDPGEEPETDPVDLDKEAANAVTDPGKPKAEPESSTFNFADKPIEEWPPELRARIEAHSSRAINQAREKWDEKFLQNQTSQQPDKQGVVSEERILELMEQREAARRTLASSLEEHGIKKGTKAYEKFASYYQQAVKDGKVTPQVLLDPAGIGSLVLLSGALLSAEEEETAGPQHGYTLAEGIPVVTDQSAENEPEEKARERKIRENIRKRLRGGKDAGEVRVDYSGF